MDRHLRRRIGWKWGLRIYGVLIALTWLALLFVDLPGTAPAGPGPDTTTASPYLDQVATSLRQTRSYTDPVLAGRVSLPAVGSADDPPLYVVALPISDADGSAGDGQLVLARLAHQVGSDGLYALVDQDGHCHSIEVKSGEPLPGYCYDLGADDLKQMRDRYDQATSPGAVRVVYPLMVGAGLCVLLAWALGAIGWVRRRRVAYLPGVR